MSKATSSQSTEMLDLQERQAWDEYLQATQGVPTRYYEERETWAWARLETRLRTIKRRRGIARRIA